MNTELLRAIADATAANTVVYVSQADALPFMQHTPPLIAVNPNEADPNDATKRAARVTEDGVKHLVAGEIDHVEKPTSQFSVLSGGFVRPKIKRGGGFGKGAPTKYPFDTMEPGQFFFVANSATTSGNAHKTMNSAVGSANQRYSEDTAETKTVTRTERDEHNKAIKGPDGKNVKETVTIHVKKFTKKFVVTPVEAGKQYGDFTAPANGAVVSRSE